MADPAAPETKEPAGYDYRWLLPVGAVVVLLLVAARGSGLVEWPWVLVLSPLTAVGILFAVVGTSLLLGPRFRALRRRLAGVPEETALTPAPERLEPPSHAAAANERILARHPEILAAVCHGLRFRKLLEEVLDHPVSDPWGVYGAAVAASPIRLEELRAAAALHTRRFALTKEGRAASDSLALKKAAEAFRRCAERLEAGRVHPDCTFEHVTVMFGARAPGRDDQLKAIAPKVRKLLERQFPQLATASLADGSSVKFAEWQKRAAREREELAHLTKEHERLKLRIAATEAELENARAYGDALRESVDAIRVKAREEARAEQEKTLDALRGALDEQRIEHTRQIKRFEAERDRLVAAMDALSEDRDALEAALLASLAEEESKAAAGVLGAEPLAGLRVLLVGGEERQLPPLRQTLEAHGVQLVHQDGAAAAELVGSAHVVVLWIRYLSHPTMYAVKRECGIQRAPVLYWPGTSPAGLLSLLAQGRGASGSEPPLVAGDA